MLLFYIRHGEPVYSPDSLTPTGILQAQALAKRLAAYGIDEIYSSSSERAKQTAEPAAELLNKPVTVLDWCNENYVWQDLTVHNEKDKPLCWLYQDRKLRKTLVSPEMASLGNKWYTHKLFKESRFKDRICQIENNTYSFLKNSGYEHSCADNSYTAVAPSEKRIALFAHEGFGMAFLSAVLDIPYPAFCVHFGLGHSSMTVIRFDGQKGEQIVPCILQLSNDSHLYKEGLPTNYNNEIFF